VEEPLDLKLLLADFLFMRKTYTHGLQMDWQQGCGQYVLMSSGTRQMIC
jgi:hypothetical protein